MTNQPADLTEVEIKIQSDDPEVITAGQYLAAKDAGWTMQAIAESMGYAGRAGLYKRVRVWEENGTLDKARRLYLMPKHEEIRAAISRVLDRWPLVLERVVRTAMHSDSDRTSLEAAAWLESAIVDPALKEREKAGSAEAAWARKDANFNPTVIKAPAFLKKIKDGND